MAFYTQSLYYISVMFSGRRTHRGQPKRSGITKRSLSNNARWAGEVPVKQASLSPFAFTVGQAVSTVTICTVLFLGGTGE